MGSRRRRGFGQAAGHVKNEKKSAGTHRRRNRRAAKSTPPGKPGVGLTRPRHGKHIWRAASRMSHAFCSQFGPRLKFCIRPPSEDGRIGFSTHNCGPHLRGQALRTVRPAPKAGTARRPAWKTEEGRRAARPRGGGVFVDRRKTKRFARSGRRNPFSAEQKTGERGALLSGLGHARLKTSGSGWVVGGLHSPRGGCSAGAERFPFRPPSARNRPGAQKIGRSSRARVGAAAQGPPAPVPRAGEKGKVR